MLNTYSHGSVVSVDEQKWRDAQEFERAVWISGNQNNSFLRVVMKFVRALKKSPYYFFQLIKYRDFYAGDDWNFWWKDIFDNYKLLPNHFSKALEVGCGPYTNMRIISKLKKIDEIHCVDPLMDLYLSFKLNWLAVMARKGKVHTYTGKGEKLEFQDNTFDLVVCNNVLDHVEDANACLTEIHRVLQPGGYFVFGQDLSDERDLDKQREKAKGFFIGHPIKLHDQVLDRLLSGLYEEKMKKVLPREAGRNSRYHYGTYLFIGVKS
ncbi:MAG: Methyltransferase type 11 [Parcubacteria group bacterium GW2011_GWB1_38_8]|nr:MAG: Methyltransferase type 11 [Parcubacteria group bacterium GW2011_GWB1_38_8]KKR29917.1 MAG: Methyltransferase type 11 [Parcubacteria group bacterium GW2011_GWC1_39_8]